MMAEPSKVDRRSGSKQRPMKGRKRPRVAPKVRGEIMAKHLSGLHFQLLNIWLNRDFVVEERYFDPLVDLAWQMASPTYVKDSGWQKLRDWTKVASDTMHPPDYFKLLHFAMNFLKKAIPLVGKTVDASEGEIKKKTKKKRKTSEDKV